MSLVLFADNLLEDTTSVVSVNPAAATGKGISRIYDRDRSLQYEGGSVAQTDIDIDLGSALPVTHIAFVNHNITGVTISIRADSSSPGTTERATLAATGVDALVAVSQTLRYWRIRIPSMANAPKIGEILLGVPRTISQNPSLESSGRHTRGNVRRDESAGGYVWGVKLGVKRTVLPYAWEYLPAADLTTLQAAYDEIDQGAKHFLLQDELGVLRWVCWTSEALEPKPHGPLVGGPYALSGVEMVEAL